mgnify:CR=1 FL=1
MEQWGGPARGALTGGETVESVDNLLRRLEQLNAIGSALSKERDITRLLESILVAAKTITQADGGTLYRVTDDQKFLRFEILRTCLLYTSPSPRD